MLTQLSIDWRVFYNSIKGSDWPDCASIHELPSLPLEIRDEILCKFLVNACREVEPDPRSSLLLQFVASTPNEVNEYCDLFLKDPDEIKQNNPVDECTVTYNGVDIFYDSNTEAGGLYLAPHFISILNEKFNNRKFANCFEPFAGAGFMGFSILGAGLCDQLVLGEIYKPAVEQCQKTINNLPARLTNKAKIYQISSLSDLGTTKKFDLIVGNPPWFNSVPAKPTRINSCTDLNWTLHRDFFKQVGNYLTDDGVIILSESATASSPVIFKSMIEENGLVLSSIVLQKDTISVSDDAFWFMVITKS